MNTSLCSSDWLSLELCASRVRRTLRQTTRRGYGVNITDGRWDQPLKVSEFLLECVLLTVFSDMRSITASFLLNLDCLVLPTFSFWLYVILHMSQSPLQRTPSSVCQRKIVWNAFTKIFFMLAFLPFPHVCRWSIRCWVWQQRACVSPDPQPGGSGTSS